MYLSIDSGTLRPVLDRHAWALLRRLTRWLDQFKDCFGHRAQHVSLRQYVDGLLSDSARKSMSAMLARVSEPTRIKPFSTSSRMRRGRPRRCGAACARVTPERTGMLILDETSFPKSGPHSVGRRAAVLRRAGQGRELPSRRDRGAVDGRPRLADGRLAVSARGVDERCGAPASARIPAAVLFQEKWRLALTLLRQTRAAGVTLTAVVADAEYGDNSTVRRTLHRLRLPYALGISPTLTVFRGTPTLRVDRRNRRRAIARRLARPRPGRRPRAQRRLAARAWRRVRWRNGTNPPWAADFAALRVTPATDWRQRRLAPEIWLLCERGLGPTGRRRHYLVSLPATASLTQLVRLAHQRWAIEQHYQDLKTELGLDHFEGRSYPGWQHHMVISAVAYAFLQTERMRPRAGPRLTFPQVRAFVQEIFTGLLFISRPRYMRWMKQAEQRFHQLRI